MSNSEPSAIVLQGIPCMCGLYKFRFEWRKRFAQGSPRFTTCIGVRGLFTAFTRWQSTQCLACLELALRERLKEEIRTGKVKGKRPALRLLLKYSVDNGLVRNEGFSAWQNRGAINSRARVEMEKIREASEKNLTEITWDESDIQITAEDLDWDYVKMLPDLLPMLRNDYAHGSTDLHDWVLRSFQIVSEIINQIYQPPA
jgi:hypothetical protein